MMHTKPMAFTLLELLVVISIITLLVTAVLPSLGAARDVAKTTYCLANLRVQAAAMSMYHHDHRGFFWPYRQSDSQRWIYFWGSDNDPVDPSASPYMTYLDDDLQSLWCPELPWGTYSPQGRHVVEATTTYGYNGRYLDPNLRGVDMRNIDSIPMPDKLFVFADAAEVVGRSTLRNSTYLEPVTGSPMQLPTNHFRHRGTTNIMCADGHVASFEPSGWVIGNSNNLGFVGTENYPHYEQ